MGRQSLKTYMDDLLRRSQVHSEDLTVVDDNARPPSQQLTPPSPYLDSIELFYSCGEIEGELSSSSLLSNDTPVISPTTTTVSKWNSDGITPAASTRNAKSGLGRPCRRSEEIDDEHKYTQSRERLVRRGAIIVPFSLSDVSPRSTTTSLGKKLGGVVEESSSPLQDEDEEILAFTTIRQLRNSGELEISEDFSIET